MEITWNAIKWVWELIQTCRKKKNDEHDQGDSDQKKDVEEKLLEKGENKEKN